MKLPIGIQDFALLRRGGYAYVDKTRHISAMPEAGRCLFLSRPRRFGKSLLCSTLKYLFDGERELFQGLWIGDRWDWSKRHPVLHLDMSVTGTRDGAALEESLAGKLSDAAGELGLTLTKVGLVDRFQELLRLASGAGRVVVLIDEYDKPMLDCLADPVRAAAMREVLRSFYGVLMASDPYLELVFLTGVSKFGKVSVFSGLN
ncbi:MAG: hypothetical protein FJ387_30900 [Verrucomicrobia bacterium]|nr:hypothetical protein [Verrucomicrobiota bacterium]